MFSSYEVGGEQMVFVCVTLNVLNFIVLFYCIVSIQQDYFILFLFFVAFEPDVCG